MAGLAAAVGGFAQGLGQGLKLRSDLDDAQAKRDYMGLQTEKLKQEVDTGKEFRELQTAMADETKNYASGLGAYAPGEGQTYDPTNPSVVDAYYSRVGAMAARQAILANKNPLEVEEFMNKARKEKFSERVMQATSLLKAGDESGFEVLKPAYNKMFNDGRELIGGTYNKENDTYDLRYKDKDGTERGYNVGRAQLTDNIVPLALNPADAAKYHLQNKEMAFKEKELQGLQDWRKTQETLTNRELDIKNRNANTESKKVDGLLTYYDRLGRAAIDKASTDKGLLALSRETNALNDQLTSVTTLLGIDRKFDPSKNDPEAIAAHDEKLARANTAMYLIKNGIKDGKLTMDSSRAIQLVNSAEAAQFSDIKKSGPGLYHVEIEGTKVPIGITDKQYKALAEANAKSEKSVEDSRRGGIKPPEQKPAGLGWGSTPLGIYR